MLIGGFSQEFIYLHMCVLDYEQHGIATVCDGDTKTIEELCAMMCAPPVWAKGLPPAFCGGNMNRYRK